MTYINRPVVWTAKRGTVVGQTEKRGKVLLTIKLDAGDEIKVALASVEFTDIDTWSQPTNRVTFSRSDRYSYDRNGRIYCN